MNSKINYDNNVKQPLSDKREKRKLTIQLHLKARQVIQWNYYEYYGTVTTSNNMETLRLLLILLFYNIR